MQITTVLVAALQLFAAVSARPIAYTRSDLSSSSNTLSNYIVVFETGTETPDSVQQKLLTELRALGAKVNYEYQSIIKGFSISLDSSLINQVESLNDAQYPFIIEQDKAVHTA